MSTSVQNSSRKTTISLYILIVYFGSYTDETVSIDFNTEGHYDQVSTDVNSISTFPFLMENHIFFE